MRYQSFSLFGPWGANPWAKVNQKGRWPDGLRDLPSCKISSLFHRSMPTHARDIRYQKSCGHTHTHTHTQTVNDISTTCLSACVDNNTKKSTARISKSWNYHMISTTSEVNLNVIFSFNSSVNYNEIFLNMNKCSDFSYGMTTTNTCSVTFAQLLNK